MTSTSFISVLTLAVSITAAVTDVRDQKIPNRLTYPAVLAGLALQGTISGWRGLLLSLSGALLFGGVFLIFHIAGAMGAGDVKLAAALGSIVGLRESVQVMFATAVAGGAIALIYVTFSGRGVQTLRNTLNVIAFHARHGLRPHPLVNLQNPAALRMPYALAFAAGSLCWAVITRSWR